MSKLQDALNHHQSTLKQAFTPQDKAVNEILLLISGEVQALHNEMATLRRDLMLFSQMASTPPPAAVVAPDSQDNPEIQTMFNDIKDLGQEVRILRREMGRIKQMPEMSKSSRKHALLGTSTIPQSNVAPMHPVEDLLDEAASLDSLHGEETSESQLSAYINRQRVRPEDIQLTPEEIRKVTKPKLRYSSDKEMTPEQLNMLRTVIIGSVIMLMILCALMN